MRESNDIEQAIEKYGDSVWRVCVLYFHDHPDAQDAFQDTFLKYALAETKAFNGEEHKKAWLLRVATNVCKDVLKAAVRRNVALGEASVKDTPTSLDPSVQPGSLESDVVDAMRLLDDPPRTPLYLSLCEGYTAKEIAEITEAPINTVYSWIARGKQQLREALS